MDSFDVIVVGSGFGGSVMAYELTKGLKTVCLLERGQAFPPGSFPRSPHLVSRNFWDPSEGYYGLFDLWAFRRMEALVASGLGGGSLIYANVLIRKPESWFVREDATGGSYEFWPVTRGDLESHYDAVETMLGGVPYPYDTPPYDRTHKTKAMEQAARELGWRWMLPKLAITFAADGESPRPGRHFPDTNLHGRDRVTCQLCGECDMGCNYGSKNTLDYNYLSRAQDTGRLDLRTLAEVRTIAPTGHGYVVEYVQHERNREGKKFDTGALPLRRVYASRLVLSAGALGSTYLLLRNRSAFAGVRDEALGSRFCTNGDLLSFVFRSREAMKRSRTLDPTRGPVITSTMAFPDALEGGPGSCRGFLLQDAGYGTFLSWLLEVADSRRWLRTARWAKRRLAAWITREPETEISGALGDLLGACDLSSSSMPLLGMGRDRADGRMRLRAGRKPGQLYLDLDWKIAGSRRYFNNVRDTSYRLARQLQGCFRENPGTRYLGRVITVHPLGGCPMGRHDREGVVNSYGEVFGHRGFYIADGSVMPGPVGTNPSLTIAALARRFAHHMLDDWPNGASHDRAARE